MHAVPSHTRPLHKPSLGLEEGSFSQPSKSPTICSEMLELSRTLLFAGPVVSRPSASIHCVREQISLGLQVGQDPVVLHRAQRQGTFMEA